MAEIENKLNDLNLEELQALNRRIVERLRLMRNMRQAKEMVKFSIGDPVSFNHDGEVVFGIVRRLNRRSITVSTDTGMEWLVSPSHLSKVVGVK